MNEKTLTCGNCGAESFAIKFKPQIGAEKWAECTECGRPTSAIGEGWRRQRIWEKNQ